MSGTPILIRTASGQFIPARGDTAGRLLTSSDIGQDTAGNTAAITALASTTVSAVALSANSARHFAMFDNQASARMHILLGGATASPTVRSFSLGQHESASTTYKGAISVAWTSGETAGGTATEVT